MTVSCTQHRPAPKLAVSQRRLEVSAFAEVRGRTDSRGRPREGVQAGAETEAVEAPPLLPPPQLPPPQLPACWVPGSSLGGGW